MGVKMGRELKTMPYYIAVTEFRSFLFFHINGKKGLILKGIPSIFFQQLFFSRPFYVGFTFLFYYESYIPEINILDVEASQEVLFLNLRNCRPLGPRTLFFLPVDLS